MRVELVYSELFDVPIDTGLVSEIFKAREGSAFVVWEVSDGPTELAQISLIDLLMEQLHETFDAETFDIMVYFDAWSVLDTLTWAKQHPDKVETTPKTDRRHDLGAFEFPFTVSAKQPWSRRPRVDERR